MRPGASASSTRNCSATLQRRIVRQHHAGAADADALVMAAMAAIRISGAVPAMLAWL